MGVAEQQLVEELLAKVQEKDKLKCELARISRERDELELMVHSLGSNLGKDFEVGCLMDSQSHWDNCGHTVNSSQSDYSEEELPLTASVHSEHDTTDSLVAAEPVCEQKSETSLDPPGPGKQLHSSGRKTKAFRGRGSIQFYHALDESIAE